MPDQPKQRAVTSRTEQLLGFLEADPNNLQLLSDAAEAALAENKVELAQQVLDRLAAIGPLADRERNLSGLLAIRQGDFGKAVSEFEHLSRDHPGTPALQFNLGWALAMTLDKRRALTALTDETALALPQAAALKVQLMHDLGEFDEAAVLARSLIVHHPDHAELLAATSVLAIDVEDVALARSTAERAGQHPDALTTMGILSLDDQQGKVARDYFARALSLNANSPRALIGMGLTDLVEGNALGAAENLERGAELFDEHVGSWIAAGWAHLLKNDMPRAETCFRRACDLDHNFAESQGSLSVLMLLTGRTEEGRRLAEIAMRLDAKSLTGALARALTLSSNGDTTRAREIIQAALNTPVGTDGKTLSQAMAGLALGR